MINLEILQFALLIWLLALVGGSILFRRLRGKPILRSSPSLYRYREGWISGYSHRGVLTFFGGARRCLTVTLTDRLLTVHPNFPLSLFFLPEVYDLDHRIPLEQLRSVEKKQKFFSTAVDVTYETARGALHTFSIFVRDSDQFVYSVQMAGRALLPNAGGPPPIPPRQVKHRGIFAKGKSLTVFPQICVVLGICAGTASFIMTIVDVGKGRQ